MSGIAKFQETHPSIESYWRSIILFGRNVASYKFALILALIRRCALDLSVAHSVLRLFVNQFGEHYFFYAVYSRLSMKSLPNCGRRKLVEFTGQDDLIEGQYFILTPTEFLDT